MIHIVIEPIYTLFIEDDELIVTGIHRFYIKRQNHIKWIAASELQINDEVLFANGTWHKILNIGIEFKVLPVFNFEVSNNHNYYVGKNSILAHNKGGGRERRRRDKVHKDNREKERYHQTDRTLGAQQNKLERIQKLKDMKYGSDYLNALKAENKQLEKQIKL